MEGILTHLPVELGQVSLLSKDEQSSSVFVSSNSAHDFSDSKASASLRLRSSPAHVDVDADVDVCVDDKDCILSQDFFCTPDYITPEGHTLNGFGSDKESNPCPTSPDKMSTVKNKKRRTDNMLVESIVPSIRHRGQVNEHAEYTSTSEELHFGEATITKARPKQDCVPLSAIALRCRVMPPPCIRNPYIGNDSVADIDPHGSWRLKCSGFLRDNFFEDDVSRYHKEFHEIEKIGDGNFSNVFKVFKRIDGCMYAVKRGIKELHLESERRKALMEVQALAALGSHENIVGYYSSWFENYRLYIQMELCEYNLSVKNLSHIFTEEELLVVMHQIAKALMFMHGKGMAHLDLKPDNIYVKKGVYKLGDLGCTTLVDKSLPIEEGDARYMPREILNDRHDWLDKVDIFSLGVSIYELVKGSHFSKSSNSTTSNLKDGRLPLLPNYSLQFQNLLKAMVDPDPVRRPTARNIVENPLFLKINAIPHLRFNK